MQNQSSLEDASSADALQHIEELTYYEIDPSKLSSDAHEPLWSVRVVMVVLIKEITVLLWFPSVETLQTYINCDDPTRPKFPTLDEKIELNLALAQEVLVRQITLKEVYESRDIWSFWRIHSDLDDAAAYSGGQMKDIFSRSLDKQTNLDEEEDEKINYRNTILASMRDEIVAMIQERAASIMSLKPEYSLSAFEELSGEFVKRIKNMKEQMQISKCTIDTEEQIGVQNEELTITTAPKQKKKKKKKKKQAVSVASRH